MEEKFNNIDSERPTALLNQEEISSLLRPNLVAEIPDISFSVLSSKPLPALNKLFNNIADEISKKLHSGAIKVWFDSAKTCVLNSCLNNLNMHLFAFPEAQNNNESSFLVFSQNATNILITSHMGGNTIHSAENKETYTNIELNIISKISEKIYNILAEHFDNDMLFEPMSKISTKAPEELNLNQTSVISQMIIEMNGHMGKFYIITPYDNIKNSLPKPPNKQNKTIDHNGRWKSYLANQAINSEINLTAILAEIPISIEDLSLWDKGYILPLNIAKTDEISIINDQKVVLRGITGRKNNNIAIKITNKVIK